MAEQLRSADIEVETHNLTAKNILAQIGAYGLAAELGVVEQCNQKLPVVVMIKDQISLSQIASKIWHSQTPSAEEVIRCIEENK